MRCLSRLNGPMDSNEILQKMIGAEDEPRCSIMGIKDRTSFVEHIRLYFI